MGFTRSYHGNITITPELVADVETIIEASRVSINGWDGNGTPVINLNEILLNGSAADGEDCETFLITNGNQYSFCKTNRNPYDLVVATILQRIHNLYPEFQISSDGGNDEEAVTEFYNQLFNYSKV